MENKDNLEKLIEAARRQKADERRQEKLCAMIDELAASEAKSNRRKLWMRIAAAACVVLVAGIGLRIVLQKDDGMKTLTAKRTVAEADTAYTTEKNRYTAEKSDSIQQPKHTVTTPLAQEQRLYASAATEKSVNNNLQGGTEESILVAENEPVIEDEIAEEPEIIVADVVETKDIAEERQDKATVSEPEKKVYVRMSNRLVSSKDGHGKEKKKVYTEPIQLLAFGGTQTSIDFNIDIKK